MFAAKYGLQHLLLPPGLFVALLLLASLRWVARKQWGPGAFSFLLAGALYALSIPPVADRLIGGLESQYEIPARPEGDVIVLLGGGVYRRAPDLTGTGFPSEDALSRLVTAARLQRRLDVPVVVSGGNGFDPLSAEAPVLARVLADLGVPREKILLEERSRDTVENARYTKEILDAKGLRRPLLVTSAYHMKRAATAFRRAGITVSPVPAGFRTWKEKRYPWPSYFPSPVPFLQSTAALREYLGLLYCRFAC